MPIIVKGIAPRIKPSGTFNVVLQGSGFTPKQGAANGDKVVIEFQGKRLEGNVERLVHGGCIAKVKLVGGAPPVPAVGDAPLKAKEVVDDDLVDIQITVTNEAGNNSGTTTETGIIDP